MFKIFDIMLKLWTECQNYENNVQNCEQNHQNYKHNDQKLRPNSNVPNCEQNDQNYYIIFKIVTRILGIMLIIVSNTFLLIICCD